MSSDPVDPVIKKALDFVEHHFREACREFIGAPVTPDRISAIKNEVEKTLSKMLPVKVPDIDIRVSGDKISFSVKEPGLISALLPKLRGPYSPWFEEGLVHVAGSIGQYEVRACDFHELKAGGYGCPDMEVTCLACLTLNVTGT